jgi:aminoglycoside phosphotransferase (APT) family kinase protein
MTVPLETTTGVEPAALAAWMNDQGLGSGQISGIHRLTGGTQNILVSFVRDGRTYVLRRPPLNKRSNSDETMRREARVLTALRGTDVPHPGLIAACPEVDVLGAAFYLMEPIDGVSALPLPEPIDTDPGCQRQLGESMIEALAAVARVDHVKVGLRTLGNADGWLARQVGKWRTQLDSYGKIEQYPGPELPHLDRVAVWLNDHTPADWRPGLMHGDFHFGNVIIDRNKPRVAAIVDWELTTIGSPLLDLGHLLANWPDPDFPDRSGVPHAPAMPSPREAVELYARASGRDVTDIKWYSVLACYRLGIILEGSNARACAGHTTREIGDILGNRAKELFEQANVLLDSPTLG